MRLWMHNTNQHISYVLEKNFPLNATKFNNAIVYDDVIITKNMSFKTDECV